MIISHEKQKDLFKRLLSGGRLSHAYIFSGLSGIGKKLFAFQVAKSLLCENGSFFEECACSQCAQVDKLTHPDLYYFSGSDLNIDNIRIISESAAMTPLSGKWKIFILDRAEVFSSSQTAAGNAILKTLEEPGDNSIFFLITDKYDVIMPTIRSRSNLVRFSPLSTDDVSKILRKIRPEIEYNLKAASLSLGSIERALLIIDSDAADIVNILENGEYVDFIRKVMSEKNDEALKLMIIFAYKLALEKYKKTGHNSFSRLGQYMLTLLKRFSYNKNADLIRADFASKVTEVFSEKY